MTREFLWKILLGVLLLEGAGLVWASLGFPGLPR